MTHAEVPLAALQMTVDAMLEAGMDVDRTKLLVDRFCKKINDGRIDYSVLYNLSARSAGLDKEGLLVPV